MTREEACAALMELGEDEAKVIVRIIDRVAGRGRRGYGALCIETDTRSPVREAAEELLDGCFYLAWECVRREP